jgi:aminoglycoside phosphotransferase (APT) family kinase protein
LSQRGLRAAVEVAEQAGLRFDRPVVLGDRSNLLVRLEPAPVVARVATTTATVRAGDAWLTREVAVAGYLARLGAPVVAPSTVPAPGPHRHDGHLLTFWEYAEELDAPPDARRAGRGLHECHEALADFDGALPPMAVLREAEDLVERLSLDAEDAAMLRRVGADVRRRIDALALPVQAVHGDAHLGNVINTARGPLWNDWEDTFLGPVAWDLGCLHASAKAFGSEPAPVEAAQAGYGSPLADEVLDAFVDARRFQGTVWTLVFAQRHPEAREWATARLAWYRARA